MTALEKWAVFVEIAMAGVAFYLFVRALRKQRDSYRARYRRANR